MVILNIGHYYIQYEDWLYVWIKFALTRRIGDKEQTRDWDSDQDRSEWLSAKNHKNR